MPLFRIHGVIACFTALLTLLSPSLLSAQDPPPLHLRLIAADRPSRPLVSEPTDFRYSPVGGLIVTDWLSGVKVGERALFPLQTIPSPDRPPSAGPDRELDHESNAALDPLLVALGAETEPSGNRPARHCDEVDPLYRGKVYEGTPARVIGPRHTRHAQAVLPLSSEPPLLTPGEIPLGVGLEGIRHRGAVVEVDCFPVRIRAVASTDPTRHVPFSPDLRWRDRDLLADLRCEHSPALPSGPPTGLCTPEGRPLRFFDLTLYLLPTLGPLRRTDPYRLNGLPFHVSATGVVLETSLPALRKTGPFELEWRLPPSPSSHAPALLPVVLVSPETATLSAGAVESRDRVWLPRDHPRLTIRRSDRRSPDVLAFEIPSFARDWTNALALVRAEPSSPSEIHLLAAPPSEATRDGLLRFAWLRWTTQGAISPPPIVTVRLTPLLNPLASSPSRLPRAIHREAGLYEIAVSGLAPGLYRLTLSDDLLPDAIPESLTVALLTPAVDGAITLATRHNRCDYRQDEVVELVLTARAGRETPATVAEVRLADETGRTVSIGQIPFPALAPSQTLTRFGVLSAASLPPGLFHLTVETPHGRWLGHGVSLRIFPLEPVTTWEGFATRICETGPLRTPLGLCSYWMLQQSPAETLQTSEDRERWLGQLLLPPSARPACESDPAFPMPEATDGYDETEQALATALRMGIRYLPHGTWGMNGQTANWNPLHSYSEGLDWMRRMYGLRAQIHREFASFGGFFMNWYPSLEPHYENHPPRAGFAEFQAAALQEAVRQVQGPLPNGWSWSKAEGFVLTRPDGTTLLERTILEAGPTQPLFRSPELQALVEWKIRGQRRRTLAFAEAYAAWTETFRSLGDWLTVSFVPVGWFRSPDYYPPLYFSTIPRAGIHAYTDWQVDPFQELFGLDYYGAGCGKPAWVQAFSGGRNFHLRQTLLAAARGAWGVGLDAKGFVPEGRFGEEIRQITGLMHRYGLYAMTLQPESTVAILRSFHQEVGDRGEFRGSGGRNGMIDLSGLQGELYTLYYNLLRSGRPAAFVTEEQIAAGELSRYQALFLHRQRMALPAAVMVRLKEFQAAGGRIFKDPLSAPDLPGEIVSLRPDEHLAPDVGTSRHPIGQRYLEMLRRYLLCRERLDALLRPLPPPRVRSNHPHILTASMAGRDTALVVAVNDTMVPPAIQTAEASWFVQGITLPRRGHLFFDQPYVLYDVTEGGREIRLERVAERPDQGWTTPVDFLHSEGRIFILTRRPIRAIQARLTLLRRPAEDALRIEPVIRDESEAPIADPLPIELILNDPQGKTIKHLYRAAGPGRPVTLSLGGLPTEGAWTIRVRELVSGREIAVPFRVPERPPPSLRIEDAGRLLIRRPEEVVRFLATRPELLIVLDEGQPPWCRTAAEVLTTALSRAGREAEYRILDPVTLLDLPLRWRRNAYDETIWREVTNGTAIAVCRGLATVSGPNGPYYDHPDSGYDQPGPRFALFRDVILIGTPDHHRLIADLHNWVGRPAHGAVPGPGAAVVQVVWDAFAPRFAALTVQAEDAEGAERAIAWIARHLKEAPSATQAFPEEVLGHPIETAVSQSVRPLPNLQREAFGTPVGQFQPLDGNRILVSLSGVMMGGPAHFQVENPTHPAVAPVSDVLGSLEPIGTNRFLQRWRDRLIVRDGTFRPETVIRGANVNNLVVDPKGSSLYMGGENSVLGLDGEGRTRWVRDFRGEIRNEADVLKPWRARVQGLSPDGRRLLVSGWRPRYYGNQVVGYEDPALLLLDTATGETCWRYPGPLIRDTVCAFLNNTIVAAHAGELREAPTPLLFILNDRGQTLQTIPVPHPVIRIHAVPSSPDFILEFKENAKPRRLSLETGRSEPLPITEPVRALWTFERQTILSTWDGQLHLFPASGQGKRTVAFPFTISTLHPLGPGQGWLAGTDSGLVLHLNEAFEVVAETDLNRFNEMESEEAWARRWRGDLPSEIPERWIEPWVGAPPRTLDRARAVATLVEMAIPFPPPGENAPLVRPSGTPVLDTEVLTPEQLPLLVSFVQRVRSSSVPSCAWELTASFPEVGHIQRFVMAASERWEERAVALRRPARASRVRLTLVPRTAGTSNGSLFEADRVTLAALRFRTPNLLRTEGPGSPTDTATPLPGGPSEPPEIRWTIPWIAHLARASGQSEQPPPVRLPWFTLTDGVISGQESSWLGKPLPQGIFCDHAEMVVTFRKPRRLAAVALYHDGSTPERITRRFALFARTANGVQWLDSQTDNQSPFTLVTFEPLEVQSLVWFWAGSPDGHIRLLEIEAYGAEAADDVRLDLLTAQPFQPNICSLRSR